MCHLTPPATQKSQYSPMIAAAANQSPEEPVLLPKELLAAASPHSASGTEVHLRLLNLLEQNPAWTQRQLADALRVSLGKTNYCLRALRDKGLVKWGNFSQNPNKLQYMHILTPKGIAQKAQLTTHFLHRKEQEFEELKREIERLRAQLCENNRSPCVASLLPGEIALKCETVPLGQSA